MPCQLGRISAPVKPSKQNEELDWQLRPHLQSIPLSSSYHTTWLHTDRSRPAQCSDLIAALPPGIVLPPGGVPYLQSFATYYAGQEADLRPSCIVRPRDANEVPIAVSVLTGRNAQDRGKSGCKFAVRGGGHTQFAGSANIADGATIDLGAISQVVVGADRTVTSVGAGARWEDVYTKLDPTVLTVVGGRSNRVGVAGLTTGGNNVLKP